MKHSLDSTIAEQIRQKLGSLSASERRVARVLLSGAPTAGLESSAKLADQAGVSGPTVSRFVTQRLGFRNYADFQQALRDEIAARVLSPVEVYRRKRVGPAEPDFAGRSGAALADSVLASLQGRTSVSLEEDDVDLGRAAEHEQIADPFDKAGSCASQAVQGVA